MDPTPTADATLPIATHTSARRVRRLLAEHLTPLTGRSVLALCSGGADSVALVAILGALPRGAAPRDIHVLWLDHALRADVAAERSAARAAADSIGATFHEARADHELAAAPGGIEAAARAWRYDTAVAVASSLGCTVLCTGHTANDQLEHALLALAAVTGRGGDADAMRVVRPIAPGIELVRPLLALSRAQVEQACADVDLDWAHDPSNADPDAHARNAIRHRVVPELLALHDGAGAALVRGAEQRAGERDATRSLAAALLDSWGVDGAALDVRRVAALDPAARRALIAAWLGRSIDSRDLGARIVQAVEQLAIAPARAACARVDLPGGACVRRDGYDLSITTAHPSKGPRP